MKRITATEIIRRWNIAKKARGKVLQAERDFFKKLERVFKVKKRGLNRKEGGE